MAQAADAQFIFAERTLGNAVEICVCVCVCVMCDGAACLVILGLTDEQTVAR